MCKELCGEAVTVLEETKNARTKTQKCLRITIKKIHLTLSMACTSIDKMLKWMNDSKIHEQIYLEIIKKAKFHILNKKKIVHQTSDSIMFFRIKN